MAESGDGMGLRAAGTTMLLTADGVELAARFWPSARPADTMVVLVHGFAASKDNGDVVALAGRLRDRGIDVISYDARGHGDSGGSCTLGDLERHDVAAAVAWARERSSRVVLVGASMGGIAVLRHAASGAAEVAGVVAVSSPAQWRIPLRARAVLTTGLTRTRAGRWVSARRLRVRIHQVWTAAEPPRVLAGRVTSPLVILHGEQDRLIPPSVALDLYGDGSGEGARRLVLVPGMGHAFDPAGHDAICDAVDWVVARGHVPPGPDT